MKKFIIAVLAAVVLCGCNKQSASNEPIYTNSYNSEIEIRMTAMAYGYYYAKAEDAGSAQRGIFNLTNTVPKDFQREMQLRASSQK